MDPFSFIVAGGLGGLILALVLIGLYHPRSGADVLDWRPTRSPETEVELELDDVAQMIAAQNEMRRKRGLPDRTEEEVEDQVRRDKAEIDAYAQKFWDEQRSLGRRPEDLPGD